MPTPIVVIGNEQGTDAGIATGANLAKLYDTITGTAGTNVKVSTASVRSGTYGLELVASAGTAFAGYFNSGNNGILGASGTLVGHFYFKYPSLPGADARIFIGIGTAGGNDLILQYLSSNNRIQANLGSQATTGPILSASTWYRVEFKLVLNANPHTLDWTVDGVAQTSLSLGVASENLFKAGWGNDNGTQTSTTYVDDQILSLTAADYPLGSHKVVQLIPDTGGTATQVGTANATGRMVTNNTIDATFNSANILAATSEVPPTLGGSASGLGQRTLSTTSACNLPMTTYTLAGGESVTGLRVICCAWANNATAAANTLGVRTHNGTTETTLFSAAAYQGQNSSTAPAWICKMATAADFDTQTELDALAVRVGYSGDITPLPGVHAVYAEVAVKESTGSSIDADAALTATATLTAAGERAANAAASLTGTATVTASATIVSSLNADAALTVTASRTATATADFVSASSLTVTAGRTATAAIARPADASLAATATITATATVTRSATAALTVTASRTAAATLTAVVTATRTTTATIAADAAVGVVAQVTTTATITATAVRLTDASASLTATASRTAVATVTAAATASVSATAAITANATVVKSASAALTVTAAIVAESLGSITFRPNDGITPRPSTGVTTRPGSGTTIRVASGITVRPFAGVTTRP